MLEQSLTSLSCHAMHEVFITQCVIYELYYITFSHTGLNNRQQARVIALHMPVSIHPYLGLLTYYCMKLTSSPIERDLAQSYATGSW